MESNPPPPRTKRDWIRTTFELGLVSFFFWQVLLSVYKLKNSGLSVAESTMMTGLLLYPSITFCPRFLKTPPTSKTNLTQAYQTLTPLNQLLLKLKHSYMDTNGTYVALDLSAKSLHLSPGVVSLKVLPTRHESFNYIRPCFTYDPPGMSKPGAKFKVYFQLNQSNLADWSITFHNRGQLVSAGGATYGSNFIQVMIVGSLGSSIPAFKKELYELSMVDATYLSETNLKCNSDPNWNPNFESCLTSYIETQMKCSLPWSKNTTLAILFRPCDKSDDYANYTALHESLTSIGSVVTSRTGCQPSCTRSEFASRQIVSKSSFLLSWPTALEFYYGTGQYTSRTQYVTYDSQNLIADIGGYLGLLLGQSLLSFYDSAKELWQARAKVSSVVGAKN